jgi:hypothetical protein
MTNFDYVENIERAAHDGLTKPDDFGYWGPDDMFETWGFCGIDVNNASDTLEESNFEFISNDLMTRFPDDFRIETYRHWLVNQVTRLVCRILYRKGEIVDKNITDAFIEAMKWQNKLANYPVANDDHYSDKMFKKSVDDIQYCYFSDMIDQTSVDWKDAIYAKYLEDGGEIYDPDVGAPIEDDIIMAAYNLKMWNPSKYQEWFDWADRMNVPRPPFDLESISYWNPNQLNLFGEN